MISCGTGVNGYWLLKHVFSRNIILDESMIRNKNFKAADCVYIRRKPEPWGHELWIVVDKESGICTNFNEMREKRLPDS